MPSQSEDDNRNMPSSCWSWPESPTLCREGLLFHAFGMGQNGRAFVRQHETVAGPLEERLADGQFEGS